MPYVQQAFITPPSSEGLVGIPRAPQRRCLAPPLDDKQSFLYTVYCVTPDPPIIHKPYYVRYHGMFYPGTVQPTAVTRSEEAAAFPSGQNFKSA